MANLPRRRRIDRSLMGFGDVDPNTLPLCSDARVASGSPCRSYVGGGMVFKPFASDSAAKQAAGCTPIEIAASPGTAPYNSCQAKLAAKASGGSGDITKAITSGLSSLLSSFTKPVQPQVMYAAGPAPSSISPTVLIAGGVGALALLYFISRR